MITNFISAITGQFTRSWILGSFVPALLFVLLGLMFVVPLFPDEWPLLSPLEALGTEWKIVVIAFMTLLLTGLLYNLNANIIRLYEGYSWRNRWLGRQLRTRHQRKLNLAAIKRAGMRTLLAAMPEAGRDQASIQETKQERNEIAVRVNRKFPSRNDLVMPTALGNVLASFEEYPDRQYGIDAVTLWPRMISKMDKDYGAAVGDAKTSFDFMLNSSLLSAIMAVTIMGVGLAYPVQLASPFLVLWFTEIIGFGLAAYVLYRSSISRALDWGDLYKGAFDLYRRGLLEQLGYKQTPEEVEEEQALWDQVSRQMIFGYPPAGKGEPLEYAGPPVLVSANSNEANLEVSRGINKVGSDGSIKVTIRVVNLSEELAVNEIIVTDPFPEGFDYEWRSARVEGQFASVTGTNPYKFKVGNLSPGGRKTLTYHAVVTTPQGGQP